MTRFWLAILGCAVLGQHVARGDDNAHATTAFVHVNVVPMDSERVLSDQTVVVEGDRIFSIGRNLSVPADAHVVDGRKTAYLLPGLADMHTHAETRDDLIVYLASGVTTVLHMGGARAGFVDSTVPAVNRGEIPGPHVYTSFLVDGSTDYNGFVIKTPAEARAIVGLARTNRYDFMKVYVDLAADVFAALADEGQRLHMPLVGHGVRAVRLARQLELGQVMVAHMEEFFYTFFTPPGVEESDVPPRPQRIPEAVALAKKYHATVTADLATYAAIAGQIGRPDVLAGYLARPESAYLSPADRVAWQNSHYIKKTAKLGPKLAFLKTLTKALADAGVELIAGTDAPAVPGMLPGFSLHDDLDELEAAGLTRYQVLSTATRMPGAFVKRTKGDDGFGIVAPGYRADLVLCANNPLKSLAALREPLGVMAHGQWRDAATLEAMTRGVRERYRKASAIY